jgi:ABC-2 type transport system permease protein
MVAMSGFLAVVLRDLMRFWKERIRLATGLLQPLLYLFVLGSGLGASSALGGSQYVRYIFPGVLGLSLLFTSAYSAITIVFDREIGFLKAVLVAPVSRPTIALGKVVSGAIQALSQALLLLLFSPLVGLWLGPRELLELVLSMAGCAMAFSGLGVAVAARFSSVEVFPVLLNAVLLPMFFLSGALFPLSRAPVWLQRLAHFDPVAYGIDLMRGALLGEFFFSPFISLAVLGGFLLAVTWASVRAFERGEEI